MCILRDSRWLVCKKYLEIARKAKQTKMSKSKTGSWNLYTVKEKRLKEFSEASAARVDSIRCSQMTATTNPFAFFRHIKEEINQHVVIWITVFYQLQCQQFTNSVLHCAVTEAVEHVPFHTSTVDVVPPTVRGFPQTFRRGLAFKRP